MEQYKIVDYKGLAILKIDYNESCQDYKTISYQIKLKDLNLETKLVFNLPISKTSDTLELFLLNRRFKNSRKMELIYLNNEIIGFLLNKTFYYPFIQQHNHIEVKQIFEENTINRYIQPDIGEAYLLLEEYNNYLFYKTTPSLTLQLYLIIFLVGLIAAIDQMQDLRLAGSILAATIGFIGMFSMVVSLNTPDPKKILSTIPKAEIDDFKSMSVAYYKKGFEIPLDYKYLDKIKSIGDVGFWSDSQFHYDEYLEITFK